MDNPLTPTTLDEIEAAHVRSDNPRVTARKDHRDQCASDHQDWPCDASRLAGLVRSMLSEVAAIANDVKAQNARLGGQATLDAARAPSASEDGPTSPYVDREEHERQSTAGTHLFDPHCPFCFFDQFDPETRAALRAASPTPSGCAPGRPGSPTHCATHDATWYYGETACSAASPTPETPHRHSFESRGEDGYPPMKCACGATPETPSLDRWMEIVSDSLAATTEGTDWAEAPEPSDEPGSPYVRRLTNEILARLAVKPDDAP